MQYHERLKPWIVVCLLPNLQRVVMGRYRRWSAFTDSAPVATLGEIGNYF